MPLRKEHKTDMGWMEGRNWEEGNAVWGGGAAGEDWEKENWGSPNNLWR